MENEIRKPINVRIVGFGCSPSCPGRDVEINRLAWDETGCINDRYCGKLDQCTILLEVVNKKGDTGNG